MKESEQERIVRFIDLETRTLEECADKSPDELTSKEKFFVCMAAGCETKVEDSSICIANPVRIEKKDGRFVVYEGEVAMEVF